MKKLIEYLKNCWKIEDLRQRILITILFVAIYRFGSFVVLPGINPAALDQLQQQTAGGLMSLLDMFSGGAFSNASIFALGIMPYISASIVMQLLAVAVPYFQKMQREGESGRKKISMYTRYLTVAILLFQAPSYLINLKMTAGSALASGISWPVFMFPATIILAAGSMFILRPSAPGIHPGGDLTFHCHHRWWSGDVHRRAAHPLCSSLCSHHAGSGCS